jgi:hypothetical protein
MAFMLSLGEGQSAYRQLDSWMCFLWFLVPLAPFPFPLRGDQAEHFSRLVGWEYLIRTSAEMPADQFT